MQGIELIDTLIEAIESDDPRLGPPGRCVYLQENGERCIVGLAFGLSGTPDRTLRGFDKPSSQGVCEMLLDNVRGISTAVKRTRLNADLLERIQQEWDAGFRLHAAAKLRAAREELSA